MEIYSTMTREKEELNTLFEDKIRSSSLSVALQFMMMHILAMEEHTFPLIP